MNKVFRIIWNRTLGRLVVASEAAHSQGKSGAERLQAAPKADDRTASAGRLRPLVLAIGLAAAGAVIPAAIAQDATYDNVTVNNELIVSDTAILSALQVSGTAAFDGPLTVGGVNVATTTDISSLNDRVDSTEGDINANANAISANAGDISANQTEIANVKATASAGWNISAEGGAEDNVAPGGSVDFSGDGNIEVGRDGTELTFSLADEIEVESVTAGDVTLGASGLAISGGPSVTSDGIDAGGGRITNVAAGDLSADSSDAVIGSQIFDLFIGEEAGGVRYFRARSAQPDSEALGDESIAIGPRAKTTETAEGAIALGQGASVGTEDGAVDDGEGSIAIGRDSQASGTRTLALGDSAEVEDERVEDAMALGTGARVSGMESDRALAAGFEANASAADATALGASASASGGSSTALGAGSSASGGSSIALGDQASATAGGALAAGAGSVAATANSISLGTEAGVRTVGDPGGDRTDHIAIGRASGQNVVGNQNTAIGLRAGSGVEGNHNVAIGTRAGQELEGNFNVALGHEANRYAGAVDRATAIGGQTSAGRNAVAMGYKADAENGGVALGSNTSAVGSNTSAGSGAVALGRNAKAEGGSVALGAGSAALSSDAQGAGYLTGSSFSDGTVVSVGNTDSGQSRRIVNVADGAQDLDAVNVGQLKGAQQSVATLIGGDVVLNPDGTYSPITVQNTDGDDVTFATVVEAIGAVTSGEVDILPVDAVRYNAEGGISNLSAGINATDAVNVEQLNEAVAESGAKYFSVNSNDPDNRDNTRASGTDAMAIGPSASADGRSSLAAGHLAETLGDQSVALGYSVEALGSESTAIGSRSDAYGDGGVAIGQRAVSKGENSIVIGTASRAEPKADGTVDNAIVIGTKAEATADNGIAIGESALASEERAVAQGFTAHALADDAQAYGSRAQATGVSSQASGTDARASGANAQASGTDARASGTNAIATGTDARGYASDGIALGTDARSGLANPLPEETDRNSNGIAIGNSALADNRNALALGVEAQAREESSTALGDSAEATAVDALAVGSSARSTAEGASALGEGAEATHERSVALGAGSTTSAPIGTSGATIDKVDYDYAGADPVATVSVGSEGEERTITNVAAGRVSATSTDAINGSQLHGTNMALESLADDLDTAGTSVADVLGGNASYDPETHQVTTSNVGGTGEDTVHDAIEYAAQGWDIRANNEADGENVAPGGSVDFSNTDGNIVIARDGTDLTFGLSDELEIASSITVGDTVIDGDRIATNNLNVGGGTFVVEGDNVTYGGNEVATQADGLSFAGNTGGTIDKTLGDDTPLTISGGLASSEASTDANLRVDSDGDQLNLVMARHLTNLDSVTTGDTVMDSDGVTVGDDVALDDSGLTIAGGPSVTDAGIDAGNQVVSNVADGVADSDAVNVGQLTDLAETPLTFAGDSGSNVERELGETLNLVGGETDASALVDGNIGVVADGTDTLSIQLAQDVDLGSDGSVTTGDTVMDSDGVNIGDGDVVLGDTGLVIGDADGPRFTGEGISAGDQVITNVARGVDGSDAVNVDQLGEVSDVANRGWNISAQGGSETNVAPGGSVDLNNADGNLVLTKADDSNDVTFDLAESIDLGEDGSITTGDTVLNNDGVTVAGASSNDPSTTIGAGSIEVAGSGATPNTVIIDGESGTIGGLTNLDFDPDNIVSGQAATEDQLGQVSDVANAGWNVSVSGEGALEDGSNNVGPEGVVDFSNTDGNILIDRDGTDLTFGLSDELEIASSITVGDTVMDSDGVNIGDGDVVLGDTGLVIGDADGPRFTDEGISAGDQVITNVARGVDGSDAVNVDQLGEVSDVANRGWNVSANGEDEPANVAPGGTVDFGSSDENIVITRDGTDLDFALADDLTGLESIGLNGIDGADGLTIRGGNGSPGTPGLDGEDGITRIIYEDADGTPYEVATMDDGLVFAGNTGDDIARTLGETLTVSGELAADDDATGANLRVDSDGDQLNLVMARNLTELDSVTTGDTVMDSDGVNIGDGDVVLGNTGLVIGDADGPRFTGEGISAGDQVITNVARGVDGSDAVNVDQLGEVSDVANRGWNVSANGEDEPANVAPGGTVDFGSSDENIVITRDGTDLDFALADDLTGLESIGLNGIDGADGLTIRGGNGSPGTPGLDGEDGITRIIYEDADGTPYEVATMDDGLVFAGNTGDDIARTLGETLTVSGELAADDDATGANLRVDSDGDQLNLVMARNLTELDSVTTGDTVMDSDGVNIGDGDVVLGDTGLVIGDADGPRFTDEGISAGDQVITNVARGVDGSDAVNVDQLGEVSDVANRGWNVSANGEDEPANVAPGGTVDFGSSDENIVITRDGTDLDFALADDLTGLESIGLNGIDGADGLTIRGGNGSPGTPGLDGEDGITRIIYEDADGTPYEVATMDDGLVFAGNTGDDIARTLGETLTVSGELAADDDATGANLRVDSDGDQLNLVMARNLTELDSVTTGDTVMDSDGVNIGDGDVVLGNTGLVIGDADGPRFTGEGISAGDQVITNVARGVDGSDAVNVDQLGEVSDVANRGWNISAQGGSETNVAPGGSVDLNNADGNLVLTKADDSNDVTFDLAESIDLGEDGSITTGDTVVNNDGVTVAGASSNDPSTTIGAGSIEVAGSGATPNTVVIDGESGTIGGLTNLGFDPDNIVSGQAATEDQLGQVSDVANAGWNVSVSGEGALEDGSNNVGPEGVVDFSNTDGNILIDRDGTDLTFGLSDELEIASSITVGDTVMDSDGVNIGDGDVVLGNTGLAVGDVDGDGASTEVGAGTITLAANPTTGPANEIVIDANSGTIGGLTNRDFDPDNFVSGQAATEDQLGQVYTVANAGWNVSVGGEGALEDGSNNVGPEGVVDFSNTDGNILIDRDGTDLAFNLNPELDLGEEGSVTIGGTIMNGEGVSVGDDVTLGDTGLIIGDADGPRFTNEGISAGDQVITGVADGDVTETSTDAINGSQLYAVQNIAQAGWNLSGSGENAVNIGPDGSVDFQGDSNITVSQTGVDQNGVIQVALNDSITLGEGENAVTVDGENGLLSVGDTIMSGEGVSVGDDVRLGSTGLVINDGPSVTTSGIDAGGMRITNLMAGVEATDAVNVSQLNEGVAAATTEVTAGSNISVSESTGDNGQTIYTVETQRDVNFDSIEVGSVNIDQNNVDENGNTIITGVGRGEVSENSTDAVNGSQLWDVQQELGDINQSLDGGMNFAADEGDAVNRRLGDTVAVTGDDNITTRTTGDGVQVTMNRDLDVDSVTTGRTTVSDQGVTIDGGPSMTVDGIDGGGMRITNVAPGVDATDAVNVGQMQELNQRFANEINNVHGRIDNVERNANAGTASALAAGTVPQAWMPGKSMVGVGAGTYEGESAVSVGVSRLSDNGRWVIQGKVTGDSQSNFGAGVGAGWHW
ncbi:YadA-like family protein [Halomonas mongoliensis]|uniref:YadA-like family protein n=1 Tax=Halomonas mongoliensis TaxID=321265 RepID=UPI00403AEF7F